MAKQHRAPVRVGQNGLGEQLLVGEGADAVIWRTSSGTAVRKRYLDQGMADRARLAEAEYSALMKARNALESVSGVTCPLPYEVDRDHGELIMEYCGGEQLDVAIGNPYFADPQRADALARSLSEAMLVLAAALPITQLDFSIRNTLLSEDLQRIVLIDFTTRPKPAILPDGAQGIECALASFLTSAITYQIRRSSLTQLKPSQRLRRIAETLVQCTRASQEFSVRRVRAIAWQYYWRQSNNRGWKRYLWFHTCGAVMFWTMLRHVTRVQQRSD